MVERRKTGIKLTRRFYYLIIGVGALLVLVIIIATATCSGSSTSTSTGSGKKLSVAEMQQLKISEAGSVMILEYHKIGEEGRWSRSPDGFRSELQTLYDEGYRAISLTDWVTDNIKAPAGTTPVILTFDDADISQFRYLDNGQIDPNCAVGIMEQFAKDHPDFGMTATFYVLPGPFGQEQYAQQKLEYLRSHGYDIGNHTVSHTSLEKLTDDQAVEEIAKNIQMVQGYLPGYEEKSIALPNGSEPKNPAVLVSGTYEGTSYSFVSSLLVGSNPSPAPGIKGFSPMRMPRVQSLALSLDKDNLGSEAWLNYFRDNPERRYRSDGDPNVVTVPQYQAERINQADLGGKQFRTY